MIKFKQLLEKVNRVEPYLKPKAQGEKEFADMHNMPMDDEDDLESKYPEYPDKKTTNALNAKNMKVTDKHDNKVEGERSPIMQGSSKIRE